MLAMDELLLRTRVEGQLRGADGIHVVAAVGAWPTREFVGSVRPDVLLAEAAGAPWARAAHDHLAQTAPLVLVGPGHCGRTNEDDRSGSPRLLLNCTASAAELAAAVRSLAAHPASPEPRTLLSPREREVLSLLVEGRTNPQIAHSLFLSPTTVKSHVSTILRKLGVENRVQLAALHAMSTAS
ncbi:response regulator transcription factor [Streptomyces sp. NPDC058683]|uniref:helix-turn-helix transcriptional regulator n=1 Tax=Streptomyces sp. NPDC058683 TaxID=3346597 RepID=UPI00364A9AE7